jgi:DivIVA domain-containing protein
MALDRHSVTRTDFPMSRRGYDRIAVDRHLEDIAQQLELFQRPSVGATASAQVQSILDAAEASAAAIEQRAWDEASRVQQTADEALGRARQHVGAVGVASRALRERIEGLLAEVEALEGSLGGMSTEAPAPAEDSQDTMAFDPLLEDDVAEAALAETPDPQPAVELREPRFGRDPREANGDQGHFAHAAMRQPPPASQEARESARLVVLNMADGGQPREVAETYLADLYPPDERAALLDAIYGPR